MPVASMYMGIADTKHDEDVLYTANVTTSFDTSDFAGAAVYSAKLEDGLALPDWLTINAATGIINGLPEHDDARQIHNIVVTVTDAGDLNTVLTDSYYLYILNGNDAPIVAEETYYAEINKSSSATDFSSWIWASDADIDSGYSEWATTGSEEYEPVVVTSTQEVLTSGETRYTSTNPFNESRIVTYGDDGFNYSVQLSSGLDWNKVNTRTSTSSSDTVTSSIGDNYIQTETAYTDGGLSYEKIVINGDVRFLGNTHDSRDLNIVYVFDGGNNPPVLDSVSGQLVSTDLVLTPAINSNNDLVFTAQSNLGVSALGYGGYLYDLPQQQGTYGSIIFDIDGNWVYKLDHADADTIALGIAQNPINGTVGLERFQLDVSDGYETVTQTIYIEVTGGLNAIFETASNTVHGDAVANTLQGDAIVKVIYADAGDDDISGGAADNALHGGMGNDHIKGEGGDDQLFTGTGVDLASGGAGSDEIYLTADGVWGGGYVAYNAAVAADDIGTGEMIVLSGYNRYEDVVDGGGAEYDCLILSDTDDAFFLEDAFSQLHSQISTVITADNYQSAARIANIDAILAGAGNDIIDLTTISFASHSTDMTVYGEAGNDHLWGGVGDDHLRGGDGDDRLVGGSGYDRLHGGNDADQFAFTATSGANKIDDFNTDEDDSIMFYYQQSSVSGVDASELDAWLYANLSVSSQQNGTIVWDTQHGSNVVEIDLSLSFSSAGLGQQFFLDNIVFEAIV